MFRIFNTISVLFHKSGDEKQDFMDLAINQNVTTTHKAFVNPGRVPSIIKTLILLI